MENQSNMAEGERSLNLLPTLRVLDLISILQKRRKTSFIYLNRKSVVGVELILQ